MWLRKLNIIENWWNKVCLVKFCLLRKGFIDVVVLKYLHTEEGLGAKGSLLSGEGTIVFNWDSSNL